MRLVSVSADSGYTRPTISAGVKVNCAPNADVDHTEKALVLLLELLLVEYLNCKYALVIDSPVRCVSPLLMFRSAPLSYMSKLSFQYGLSVFLMTPVVLVCSPLMVATAKGSGNPVFLREHVLLPKRLPISNILKTSLLYNPSAAITASGVSLPCALLLSRSSLFTYW